MFKIRLILFVIGLIFIAILINGCSKAECEAAADCTQKTCMAASCVEKQCRYDTIPNCCGNNIEDAVENGKPGNSCTCPQDYGKCGGRTQISIGSRTYDSEFLEYYCSGNECILGVPDEKVRPITLLDDRDFKFFKFEIAVTYNEPFDVTKDSFNFRVGVTDSEDLVFPVKLRKIILNNGEILFGEKILEFDLNNVGNTVSFTVPVTHRPDQPEEQSRLSYRLDFEYTKVVKGQRLANGSYTYKEELVRDEYSNTFTTKINLVRPK